MNVRETRERRRSARFTVDANEAELSDLRAALSSMLREHDVDADTIDDLQLVVSELATNVIQHTSSSSVTLTVDPAPSGWTIAVADADDIPVLAGGGAPTPDVENIAGRGLFIVHALMDSVELAEADGVQVIRCFKSTG